MSSHAILVFVSLAAVSASAVEPARPSSFRQDVIPALTVAGCNAGSCHGKLEGVGGLRLSLNGADPAADFATLARSPRGRLIDQLSPANSLLVKKGTGRLPHEGGKGFFANSVSLPILLAWIAEGCREDHESLSPVTSLTVQPGVQHLIGPQKVRRLTVEARFADGGTREVTSLTAFRSSDDTLATVSTSGIVTFRQTGEVAILCRYTTGLQVVRLWYVEAKPTFVWIAPPEVNYIDTHVFAKLKQLQLPPAELCTDTQFLRRACMDLCALQPSPEMLADFVRDPDPRKREKLVERLLGRGDHADFWTLKWLLALESSRGRLQLEGASAYRAWLRRNIADNRPFDAVVRELLTATGHGHVTGPANYHRYRNPAEAVAELTGRVFLGVNLGCARCHHHPYDRWTSEDRAGLAAFFARLRTAPDPQSKVRTRFEIVETLATGDFKLPSRSEVVAPRFLGGDAPVIPEVTDRREVLAKWLTAKENPFFAKVIVNRIWSQLFGRGIVEPIDDFRESNPSANDALLDALAQDFRARNYDVRHLLRTILASRTYQLSSVPHPQSKEDRRYFSRAYPQRLSPEQLLEALSTVLEIPGTFADYPAGTRAIQVPDPQENHALLLPFGRPAQTTVCEADSDRGSPHAMLHLMSSDEIQKMLKEPNNRLGRLLNRKATEREITEEIFLATLCRLPTAAENVTLTNHLRMNPDKRQAWEDLFWALLNTKEFMFRQ